MISRVQKILAPEREDFEQCKYKIISQVRKNEKVLFSLNCCALIGRREDRYESSFSERGPPPRSRDPYPPSPPRDSGRGAGILDR